MLKIPDELKELKQWTCYRIVDSNGKNRKIPFNPLNNKGAKANDPATWVTYDDAINNISKYDGVGFYFSKKDPYCGIDIDYCIENGIINDIGKKVIEDFASYTEISPSGNGLHIIVKGNKPEWSKSNKNGFEVYDKARYFTMTGNAINDSNIKDRQDILLKFCIKYLNTDDDLTLLFDGHWTQLGYPSQSEADMALARKLIPYLGQSIEAIENQMRSSKMNRKKYDKNDSEYTTYLRRTIIKAIESHTTKQFDCIETFNKKHAVVLLEGSCVILNEIDHPINGKDSITFSSFEDFKKLYLNHKIMTGYTQDGTPIYRNAADTWLKSPKRRQYDGIVFSPDKDYPRYFNLFRGFSITPKEGDWSLFKKHIFEVIASGDQKIYEYIISWMAHVVQFPGAENKPGVSIVLKGKQGTGKGIFVTNFGKIFGPHFLHLSSSSTLTGRFNTFLKDKILVYSDESVWTGDKHSAGMLKTMVTEDTILIEPKGKESFAIQNHIRLIISSNEDWIVPAGLEERRFFVLEVSDQYIKDHHYFENLMHQMNNGGREAMFYDLLNQNLADVNLKDFPRTTALLRQIERSMPVVYKWWYDRLSAGSQVSTSDKWEVKIGNDVLYNDYKDYVLNCGCKNVISPYKFGREIKHLCPPVSDARISEGGQKKPAKQFPELSECRAIFEQLVNICIEWK